MRVEEHARARIAQVYGIVSQFGGAIALDSRSAQERGSWFIFLRRIPPSSCKQGPWRGKRTIRQNG